MKRAMTISVMSAALALAVFATSSFPVEAKGRPVPVPWTGPVNPVEIPAAPGWGVPWTGPVNPVPIP